MNGLETKEQIFGILKVVEDSARDWENKSAGFKLSNGDSFLEIQLVTPIEDHNQFRQNLKLSLLEIASYIREKKLDPKYVLAITFEKMARIARKFGGSIFEEPDLPAEYVSSLEQLYKLYATSGRKGKPMGKIMVCFQTKEDFLARFSTL